jgi:hypothetical protein
MSALQLSTIIKDFILETWNIPVQPKINVFSLIQRGTSSIVHSYGVSFAENPESPEEAVEIAKLTGDRFAQFIKQATIEQADTTLLSEALPFAYKGKTNSRVIGDSQTTEADNKEIKYIMETYTDFIDLLTEQHTKAMKKKKINDADVTILIKFWTDRFVVFSS